MLWRLWSRGRRQETSGASQVAEGKGREQVTKLGKACSDRIETKYFWDETEVFLPDTPLHEALLPGYVSLAAGVYVLRTLGPILDRRGPGSERDFPHSISTFRLASTPPLRALTAATPNPCGLCATTT